MKMTVIVSEQNFDTNKCLHNGELRQRDRETDIQTDRESYRQRRMKTNDCEDRQTDMKRNRYQDRQTVKHKDIKTDGCV
jgi:hypothetical protein